MWWAWPAVVLVLGLGVLGLLAYSKLVESKSIDAKLETLHGDRSQMKARLETLEFSVDKLRELNIPHELERLRAMIGPVARKAG